MNQRVLITGAHGMLGQHVQEAIQNNTEYSSKAKYFFARREDGDLRDLNQTQYLFEKIRPTAVVHLASGVGGLYGNMNHNYEFMVYNTMIHLNVIECCRIYSVKKLVNILSTCVMPVNVPQPLSSSFLHYGPPHESNRGYAYSKRFLELASRELHENIGTEVINLIPTNLYGKYENFDKEGNHVIPELVKKFTSGDLTVKGSGCAKRQFLYAGDFAQIIMLFLTNTVEEKYVNIVVSPSTSEEITIQTVADLLKEKLGISGHIVYDTQYPDGMIRKTVDDSELRSYIPHFRFTPLTVGLDLVLEYYKNKMNLKRKKLE